MSNQKKERPPRMLTPAGEAKWAHVHKPREPFGGDDNKEKKYEIEVHFKPDDPAWKAWAQALTARVKALPEQRNRQGDVLAKQNPIKRGTNKDGTPTGLFFATFRTSERFKPDVFDRYNRKIQEVPEIGNGSVVRVAYTESEYDTFGGGIALYMDAVQILELKERAGRTAEDYGFTADPLPEDGDAGFETGFDTSNLRENSKAGSPPPEDDLPF